METRVEGTLAFITDTSTGETYVLDMDCEYRDFVQQAEDMPAELARDFFRERGMTFMELRFALKALKEAYAEAIEDTPVLGRAYRYLRGRKSQQRL